jgi:hypothetical protein
LTFLSLRKGLSKARAIKNNKQASDGLLALNIFVETDRHETSDASCGITGNYRRNLRLPQRLKNCTDCCSRLCYPVRRLLVRVPVMQQVEWVLQVHRMRQAVWNSTQGRSTAASWVFRNQQELPGPKIARLASRLERKGYNHSLHRS